MCSFKKCHKKKCNLAIAVAKLHFFINVRKSNRTKMAHIIQSRFKSYIFYSNRTKLPIWAIFR